MNPTKKALSRFTVPLLPGPQRLLPKRAPAFNSPERLRRAHTRPGRSLGSRRRLHGAEHRFLTCFFQWKVDFVRCWVHCYFPNDVAQVNPALTSLTCRPFVRADRMPRSNDKFSRRFQINPIKAEFVREPPTSCSAKTSATGRTVHSNGPSTIALKNRFHVCCLPNVSAALRWMVAMRQRCDTIPAQLAPVPGSP